MVRTTAKVLIAVSLVTTQTACAGLVGEPLFVGEEEGRFLLSTDRAGMQAFSDALTGIAQVGKDSPDKEGAYWLKRRDDNAVQIKRFEFRTRATGGQK